MAKKSKVIAYSMFLLFSMGTLSACATEHDYTSDDLFVTDEKDLAKNHIEAKVLRNNGSIIEFEVVNTKILQNDLNGEIQVGRTLSVDYRDKAIKKVSKGDYIVIDIESDVSLIKEDPPRLDGATIVSSSKAERFSQYKKGPES